MVMNSDLDEVYSGILDATTALVDFINQTNVLKGVMAGLAINWGIKAFLALKTGIGEAYISLNKFQNALNIVKKTNISTKEFERLLLLSNGLSASQIRLILTTNNLTIAQKKELLIASGLSEQEAILQLQTWKMAAANTGLTAATVSLANAFKGLWATLIANPLIVVTALVSGAVMAYQSYQQKMEEVRQKNKEAADSAIDSANKLRELYAEYARLSAIQDRTSDEENSYKKVIEDITAILGDRAEALRGLSQDTEEYTDKLKELTQAELNEQYAQAVVGRKTAEETLQDDVWDNRKGSKVSVNANSKGKGLSDEARQAADIVSDALKKFETVNRTWGSVAWGISSDNPEEAVNYYRALKMAMVDLTNASKDNEALLDTEIYNDINTAINTLKESVEDYTKKKYEEQKLYYLSHNDIPTTAEEYRKLENVVLKAAGANEGLKASFKDLLAEDFSGLYSQVDNVAEAIEAENQQLNAFDPSTLSTAMESLSKIQSLYSDFRQNLSDGKTGAELHLPIEDIESLKDSLKDANDNLLVSEEAFRDFENVLTDQSSTADEIEDAFNNLITSYVDAALQQGNYTEETKELIKTQLELKGITAESAEEYVEYQTAMAQAKEAVANVDLAKMTYKEVEALISEGGYLGLTVEQIWALYYAKLAEEAASIDTTKDCQQFLNLAKDAQLTADTINLVMRLMEIYANLEGGVYDYNASVKQEMYKEASLLKSKIEDIVKGAGEVNKPDLNLDPSKAKKSGGGGGSSKDLYKEQYEKELKALEHYHKLGLISDAEYWKERMDLSERFFGESSGKHEKYLEEYQKNEEEILDGIKKLWKDYYDDRKNDLSDLISYAENLFDKQIDGLNEQKEALEEQRDAEEKYWQEKIDAVQSEIDALDDEIDALEDANSERQRAINLQEKQYALQRAMQQHTMLVYSESKGISYVNDTKAERDARNDLADAEHEVKVADIKKIQDGLKKQQEDLEKQLDEILKYYNEQIKAIEKQIKSLQKVKSAWSEIAANQELKELEERLKTIFGDDVKEKILSGNTDFINSIVSQYSETSEMLRTIEDATLADIQNMVAQYGVLPENLMPIAGMAAEIKESLGSVDMSSFNATLDSAAQSSSNAAQKVQGVVTALNDLSNDVSNYQIPAVNADNFMSSFEEDGSILTALKGFTERFQAICDGIPEIWNRSLSEAFGVGGGHGDPSAGGLPNDTKYEKLFSPVIVAIENCKANMEAKLKDCLGVFTEFQADLSEVIGVGEAESKEDSAASSGTEGKGSKQTGSEKKQNSESGSGTIVGAIQEGGKLIDEALNGEEESWSASFIDAAGSIHNTAKYIVECIESMVEAIVSACSAAIDAINLLERAQGGAGDHPTPPPYNRVGHGHGEIGDSFAAGTNGTTKDVKNALLSEYGQTEMAVYPNGKHVIYTEPTLADLPRGTVVYNESQTKKILANKDKVSATGSTYANGTDDEWFVGKDGHRYRPIRQGDYAWEMMKKFDLLLEKIKADPDYLVSNAMIEHNRQMEKIVKQIDYANVVTNNKNVQPVVNQTFNITLPNVTNATSAEALMKDLQSLATKKFQVNW